MVPAPCLGVIMKDLIGYLSNSSLPGCTIAFIIADNQIGRFIFVGPVIDLLSVVNPLNHRLVALV
jgi:hypothetical protein